MKIQLKKFDNINACHIIFYLLLITDNMTSKIKNLSFELLSQSFQKASTTNVFQLAAQKYYRECMKKSRETIFAEIAERADSIARDFVDKLDFDLINNQLERSYQITAIIFGDQSISFGYNDPQFSSLNKNDIYASRDIIREFRDEITDIFRDNLKSSFEKYYEGFEVETCTACGPKFPSFHFKINTDTDCTLKQ